MFKSSALALSLAIGAAAVLAPLPALAQARVAASVDLEKVVAGSSAYNAAINQINTTYAANIQQYQQLQQAANNQLTPLVQQAQTEQAKPAPNQAQLQTLSTQINQIRSQTQAQLQQAGQPIEIARAYVADQITQAITPAVQTVARNQKLGMVVSREAALFVDNSNDVTNAVIAELNRSTPQVGITPPAEWLQARGVGVAAPAPAPTAQPQGR